MVNIHLNPHADNITCDEHTISWSPTKEEQTFLFQALELLKDQEINNTIVFNKTLGQAPPLTQLQTDINVRKRKKENNNNKEPWDAIDQIINK